MEVVYVGPHAEGVDISDAQHVDRFGNPYHLPDVKRDTPVEVPDEVAQRLLQQYTNWVEADPPKKAGK